jgi:hypothetical protein
MNGKFALTKRRKLLLATAVMCTVLIVGLAMLWQGGKVTQAALVQPYPGMVCWWRFDENGGSLANDSSGNGNTGAINGAGPTWVTGKYGYALSFDGSSNYVLSANTVAFGSSVSFAAWVKIASFNPSQLGLIVGLNSATLNGIVEWATAGNTIWLEAFGHGITSYSGLGVNTWLYVVGILTIVSPTTVNGALYINGVQVASGTDNTFSGLSNFPSSQIAAGAWPIYSYGYVTGTIDEVQTYNRALSATEISAYYQTSPGFSSNLVAVVPQGTTDFIATLSWQGIGSINVTIQSPSQGYNETNATGVYQKTTYSVSGGVSTMLNIKRVEVQVGPLGSDQNWNIVLTTSNVQDYKITVEVQK